MIASHSKILRSKLVSKRAHLRHCSTVAVAAFLGLGVAAVEAQTHYYFGTSGTLNSLVWSTNPAGPYDTALDSTGGAIIHFDNPASAVTGASITVAGINATANVSGWTASGTILNFNNAIVPIDVATGTTLDFGGQSFTSAAAAGYAKNGEGVVALGGNTYGGGFTLNAGTVIARGVNAFGLGTLTINGGTIAANAARDFNGKMTGGIVVAGDFTLGATTGLAVAGSNLTFYSSVILGASPRTITLGGTGNYTFNGPVSGDAGLTVAATAAGSLLLGGANTYAGANTVLGGTLQFTKLVAFGNGEQANWTDSKLIVQPGATAAFSVGGTGEFASADIDHLKTLASATGGFQSGSSLGLDTTTAAGGAFTYAGVVGSPNGNSIGLTKLGTNTLVLTGANTYTGSTFIKSGVLQIGDGGTAGEIGSTSSIVTNGTLRVNRNDSLTLTKPISGTGGFNQAGTGTTVMTNANTYTGTTVVNAGTLTYSGDASHAAGGALTVSGVLGAKLNVETSGTLVFGGTPTLGANGESGVVEQESGTVRLGTNGHYLTIGSGGYGSYTLSGGILEIVGASGVRLGATSASGLGTFTQTGGTLNLTRYFAIGQGGGRGVANFLGGTANTAPDFAVLVGDNGTGASAVMNVGTLAGGTATIVSLSPTGATNSGISVGGNNNSLGTLNLNSGTVQIGANAIRKGNGPGTLNLNGGIVQAGAPDVTLINQTLSGTIYRNDAIFDTNGFTATVSATLNSAMGDGIYVSGGTIPLNSGSGYLGAPLVTVSGGTGIGATAIAEVNDGKVTGVTFTNPGQSYSVGDSISFEFSGGGATIAAPTFNYVLTAADLSSNAESGVVKRGAGTLNLTGSHSYTGDTLVAAGELLVNGSISGGTVIVDPLAKISGEAMLANLTLESGATVAPGIGAGTISIFGNLTFSQGSILQFDLNGGDRTTGSFINDLISTQNLTLDGTLQVTELFSGSFMGALQGDRWRLITLAGALEDHGLNLGAMPMLSEGLNFAIEVVPGSGVDLVVVPEPTAAASLLSGLCVLLCGRRRKSSAATR